MTLPPDCQAALVRLALPTDLRHWDYRPEGTTAEVWLHGNAPDHISGGPLGAALHLARPGEAERIAGEAAILTRIGGQLPIATPRILAQGPGWMLQTRLTGRPLSPRLVAMLDRPALTRLAADLAAALTALHGLRSEADPPCATPHDGQSWGDLRHAARRLVFPHLSPGLAADLEAMVQALIDRPLNPHRPALIHDDLHPGHILVDGPAHAPRLSGLLDFGRSGAGDPAVDLAGLWYNYGNRLADPLLAALGWGQDDRDRALRLCRTYELQWAVEGMARQDPAWLLYALGGAKGFG